MPNSLVLADKPSVSALSAIQWLIMNFIIIHIGLVIVLRETEEYVLALVCQNFPFYFRCFRYIF